MAAVIRDLFFYPIKSFRGLHTSELMLTKAGPLWDREWMLVDDKGVFLTQRQHPELAKIGVRFEDDAGLELSAGAQGTMDFGLEEREGPEFQVTVWKTQVPAFEVSSEVSEWLSDLLTKKVKLVRLSPNAQRTFDDAMPERTVRFVDAKPLLVISTASLKQLELKAGVTLAMSRFRPNIVIDGVEPHAEDGWPAFKVGSIEFKTLKPCTRCKITTVHPLTGAVSEEPLKTLSTYRRGEKGITFGQYFAHMHEGRLRAGAPVGF
ncbi:MAG: MOSC domain-containing protein [Bdellovibrionales bacterium]|nr:MOSC domain-containing protein [Bdellovibrionales bacterium]